MVGLQRVDLTKVEGRVKVKVRAEIKGRAKVDG